MSVDKTTTTIVSFFEKLITEFSWRRLLFVVVFAALMFLCFVAYEYYTRSFKLTRLDRQAGLIERAIELDTLAADITDADIRGALAGLKAEIHHVLVPPTLTVVLSSSGSRVIYSLIPWFLLGFLIMVAGAKGSAVSALMGLMVFAVPFVVLNVKLPEFEPIWISNWLIPWSEVLLTVYFVVKLNRYKARKAA